MARKTKTETVKVVPRGHGLEAVYERHQDGTVTRAVRKAGQPEPEDDA